MIEGHLHIIQLKNLLIKFKKKFEICEYFDWVLHWKVNTSYDFLAKKIKKNNFKLWSSKFSKKEDRIEKKRMAIKYH